MSGRAWLVRSAVLLLAVVFAACEERSSRELAPTSIRRTDALRPPLDTTADQVMGQANLTASAQNYIDELALSAPEGAALDTSVSPPRLYVVDSNNSRVLGWPNAQAFTNGAPASVVIGQTSATGSLCNNGGSLTASTLCYPRAAVVDAAGTLYVADASNNRVLAYTSPFTTDTTADRVYGQTSFSTSTVPTVRTATSLAYPSGVALDQAGNLYVADSSSNRVVRYNAPLTETTADLVLGQGDFSGSSTNRTDGAGVSSPRAVAVDRSISPNRVYVADTGNHRVLGWANAVSFTNGAPATLVIGQATMGAGSSNRGTSVNNNTLSSPSDVFVDASGNLYVADTSNNRVLRFDAPFTTDQVADAVFGQATFTTSSCGTVSATTLCQPYGIAVNAAGEIAVADNNWNRVVVYTGGVMADGTADRVYGQPTLTSSTSNNGGLSASSLYSPRGVAWNSVGGLFVADYQNSRVLYYAPTPADAVADNVFGQTNFTTSLFTSPSSTTYHYYPTDLVVDGSDNLWVSDYYYARVLGYLGPTTDSTADAIIGKPTMTTTSCTPGAACTGTFHDRVGLDVSSAGSLWVADGANNRVLRFDTPFSDVTADGVLGQTDFLSTGVNLVDGSGFSSPTAVTVDATQSPNVLYVADTSNNRVLRWNTTALSDGASANVVLGQASFATSSCASTSTTSLCGPRNMGASGGRLLVADQGRNRVLRFDTVTGTMDNVADAVVGQTTFTSSSCNTGLSVASSLTLCSPTAVLTDASANLYVVDGSNHRLLQYTSPFTTDLAADAVLGQPDFTARGVNRIDARGMTSPGAVAIDRSVTPHRVYVADTGNSRVLGWPDVSAFVSGAPATLVIGQVNFHQGLCNQGASASATTLCSPYGLAVDDTGRLWVADTTNHRVLAYTAPFTTDTTADLAIGQADFTSTCSNRCSTIAANTFSSPMGLVLDASGALYVADQSNNRVLSFPTPTNNATATRLWGQTTFTTGSSNQGLGTASASTLYQPRGLALDRVQSPARLYVADGLNYRVLGFDNAAAGDAVADVVLGQPDFTNRSASYGSALRYAGPRGVTVSADGNLYVTDTSMSRVLEYVLPSGGDLNPDRVFGQTSFTNWGCNSGGVSSASLCSPYAVAADTVGSLFIVDTSNHRVTISLANNRPTATSLTLTPSTPTTTAVLTAAWTYGDLDGDSQSGTTISWLKNGVVQAGLTGTTVAAALTTRGDQWSFVIRPSDGIEFGVPANSPVVTIANTAPVVSSGAVLPAGARTTDTLQVSYAYSDADADSEGVSDIRWYKNAVEQTALRGLRTVAPANTAKGEVWWFSVAPSDGTDLGSVYTAPGITIANTPPTSSTAAITPSSPRTTDSLTATNNFSDVDGDLEAGSEIRWYRNTTLQTALNDQRTVAAPLTVNDTWYFTLRPRDGTAYGALITSGTVVVGSLAPSATNLTLTPTPAYRNNTLTRAYTYSDPDSQAESGSTTRWYLNSVEQTALLNQATVPGTSVLKGQSWYFTVRPCDSGGACGPLQTSATLVISNTAPTATAVTIAPAMPTSTQSLSVTWTYADADGDTQSGTEIRWFKNNVEQPGLFGLTTVPASSLVRGEAWYARITPRDGTTFGTAVNASPVVIGNSLPVASALTLTPTTPRATDTLVAGWTYSDPDGDAQVGSEVRWYRNSVEVTALLNSLTVPPTQLAKGQQWRFTVRPRDGVAYGTLVTSPTVTVQNSAPVATNLTISPANPLAGQALTASYTYSDADADAQMGSEVRWYKNGVEQTMYLGLTTVPAGVTLRADRWSFSVRPNDGTTFGTLVTSTDVSIANSVPNASNPAITPSPARTLDPLVANYSFSDADGDTESASELRWYRNGVEQPTLYGLRTVPTANTTRGQSWYFTLRPGDGIGLGPLVTSQPITIINTAPTATNVSLTPLSPRTTDTLTAGYTYGDADTDAEQGSELRWYKDGVEQTAYFNQRTIPAGVPRANETWRFSIRPRDGVEFGTLVNSTNIVVGSSLPVATALAIAPAQPLSTDTLAATYFFSDPDGDPEANSQLRWQRGGVDVTTLNDLRTLPAGTVRKGEVWTFTVRPGDGTGLGALQSSPAVTIGNGVPVATMAAVTPPTPNTTDVLTASFTFTDPDGDPEASSEIRWFRNGLEVTTLADQATVPASATTKGEVWYYRLRPGDGDALGVAEVSTPVFITNSPPVANAGPDRQLTPTTALTRVRLDGTGSSDADNDVLSFNWKNAAGDVIAVGNTPNVDLPPGQHVITLEVTDGPEVAADTVTIDITAVAVTVTLPADSTVPPGPVTVAPAVTDPLSRPFTARWTQVQGPTVPLPTDGGLTLSYFALPAGERRFELVLESASLTTPPQQVSVTTRQITPVAWLPTRIVTPVGRRIEIDGTRSDDANADPLTFTWSGDVTRVQLDGDTTSRLGLTPTVDGVSSVRLLVNDGTTDSTPAQVEVIAIDPSVMRHGPVAHAGEDLSASIGKQVTLDGRASYDVDGDALSYTWRSISGPSLELSRAGTAQPTVRATSAGRAVIGLIVGDGASSSVEDTMEIDFVDETTNQRPIARVTATVNAALGADVVLDASRSADPDGDAITWEWTQLSGSPLFLDDPAAARPRLTALRPGAAVFSLVVFDGTLRSLPVQVTVLTTSPGNTPPTASAGPDQSVLAGTTVSLDGRGSSDPEGDPLTFLWEQVQGPPVVLEGTPDAPLFNPRGLGRFVFRLTVFDREAPGTPDEVVIVVATHGTENRRPVARVGPMQEVAVGATVTLDGSGSSDADPLDRLSYRWAFVTFPTGSEPTLLEAGTAAPSFVVDTAGPYTVRLVVSDGDLESEPVFVDVVAGVALNGGGCGCSTADPLSVLALGLVALAWRGRRRRHAVGLGLALLLVPSLATAKPKAKPKPPATRKVKPAEPTPTSTPDDTPDVAAPGSDAPVKGPSLSSPGSVPNPYLDEARELFANFQLDGLLTKLEFALAVKGISPEQRAEIFRLMAFTHASFDDFPKAEDAFVHLLEVKPDAQLQGASPKVRQVFENAQRLWRERQAVKLTHAPPVASASQQSTTIDVVAQAGGERIGQVTLHYRAEGAAGGFSQVPMSRGEQQSWSATMPNQFDDSSGRRKVEYFIRARDKNGGLLASIGEETKPMLIEVDAVATAGPPIYKSPWFWAIAGVLVVGAAAGTTAAVGIRPNAASPVGTLGVEKLP